MSSKYSNTEKMAAPKSFKGVGNVKTTSLPNGGCPARKGK